MTERHFRLFLRIAFVLPCIGTLLLCLVPFVSLSDYATIPIGAYFLAGMFWISIGLEIFCVLQCTGKRKQMEGNSNQSLGREATGFGVIHFFRNREATAADFLLFISAIAAAIIIWFEIENEWIIIGAVSLLFFSFHMHCLLNGRNYRYYKILRENRGEEHEHHE